MRKSLGMVLFVLISFAPLSNAFAQSTVGSLVTITGRCLDVDNVGGVRNGSRVQVWDCTGAPNQLWHFTGGFGGSSGRDAGQLVSSAGNKCLDVHRPELGMNGGRMQVWDCHGEANQKWDLDGSRHLFSNAGLGNKCLDADINPPGVRNGTKVQLWDCYTAANQNWTFPTQPLGGWCGIIYTELACPPGATCKPRPPPGRIDKFCQ